MGPIPGGTGGSSPGVSDQILLEEGGGYWRLEESTDQILQEE